MRFMMSLVLGFALCGSAGISSAMQVESDCQNVRGTVEAQITGFSTACPFATVTGDVFDDTGTQIGSTTACIANPVQQGNGSLHVELSHTYSIAGLNFTTDDDGVLTNVAPNLFRFENRLTIVDGAEGFLRAHGLVDLDSLEINLTFNGRICVE